MKTADLDRALRVVIGEDDVLHRKGIARVISESGMKVIARSGDAHALLNRALAYRPDALVTNVQMPPRGEDDRFAGRARGASSRAWHGVLILSQFCQPHLRDGVGR